jgi:hypothetical protein
MTFESHIWYIVLVICCYSKFFVSLSVGTTVYSMISWCILLSCDMLFSFVYYRSVHLCFMLFQVVINVIWISLLHKVLSKAVTYAVSVVPQFL